MSKAAIVASVLACLATSDSVFAAGESPPEVVTLTKPGDIQQASAMDTAIVRLSDKAMECARTKLAPAGRCFCLYPRELSDVQKTYETTMKTHPEWRNAVVTYLREGRTFAVSFGGVGRQLETKCPQHR